MKNNVLTKNLNKNQSFIQHSNSTSICRALIVYQGLF